MHGTAELKGGAPPCQAEEDMLRHIFDGFAALFRPSQAQTVCHDRATESAFISIMNALKKD